MWKWCRNHGAVIVDNLEISNLSTVLNYSLSGELLAAAYDFRLSLNSYLADLESSPIRSLADAIAFNLQNPVLVNFSIFYLNHKRLISDNLPQPRISKQEVILKGRPSEMCAAMDGSHSICRTENSEFKQLLEGFESLNMDQNGVR